MRGVKYLFGANFGRRESRPLLERREEIKESYWLVQDMSGEMLIPSNLMDLDSITKAPPMLTICPKLSLLRGVRKTSTVVLVAFATNIFEAKYWSISLDVFSSFWMAISLVSPNVMAAVSSA